MYGAFAQPFSFRLFGAKLETKWQFEDGTSERMTCGIGGHYRSATDADGYRIDTQTFTCQTEKNHYSEQPVSIEKELG